MGRTIEDIDVHDVEKRKIPSKHYVYVIHVTWSDGSVNIIFRRYSRFFDFQNRLIEMYPDEAGAVDPNKRIIPFLPGKKFFGRSHIREVAVKRLGPIADYCKQIVKLPRRISQCKEVMEFFEMDLDDMNPQKGKKASMKAKKISTPKPLEVYLACTDYKKQEKGEVTLKVGMPVEVVEKTETGWWFVNADEEQGWVPSTCLQREDGEKEDTTVRFKDGEEEQYLCTEEFKACGPDEISMERGAVVDVLEKNLEGWWRVRYNGIEGYVPATYLMKTESFQVRKKLVDQINPRDTAGPQIVRSLAEISNLLQTSTNETEDDTYTIPDDFPEENTNEFEEEEEIYTIHEISRILKENKQGDRETEQINANIRNMKSGALKRGGSVRPPPRPSIKPKFGEKNTAVVRPTIKRQDSMSLDYITIADFADAVGDGISFTAGKHAKVLEKTEGGWWYVQIDGNEGWAPATYIEKAQSQEPPPAINTAASRPLPPPPPSKSQKPKFNKGSREDLTEDEDKKDNTRRVSAVEGLKGALKAKLQNRNKSPPVPPKKDFLDHDGNTDDSDVDDDFDDDDQDDSNNQNFSISLPSPPVKSGDSSPRFSLPHKPLTQKKSKDRNMLNAPPPPPQAAKVGTTDAKPSQASSHRPLPPLKVKSNFAGTDGQQKKIVSSSSSGSSDHASSEENSEKINVAGLAGALKAKFENKDKPTPSSIANKPKVESKPIPPNTTQKPKLDTKPTPPSLTQKPKLDAKPSPPSVNKKPTLDGNTKPVLNKVEFPPSTNRPVLPGKPGVNKPTSSAIKPSAVKSDTSVTKPSWIKQEKEGPPKPPWVKDDDEQSTKPSWTKPDTNKTPKPAWKKPNNEAAAAKPSWMKHDSDSKSDSGVKNDSSVPTGKVSDLASVLKSKFENRTAPEEATNSASSNRTDNKPVTALKPKPARPSTPPNVPSKSSHASPTPGKKGLDPKKYSSRPLPAKPGRGPAQEDNNDKGQSSNKPPALPFKPKSGGTSEDDNYIQPVGSVSDIANALKAKLGAAHNVDNGRTSDKPSPKQSSKPTPTVPVKPSVNNSTENLNNNNSSDQCVSAIADYDANNEGEMSLNIGEQYTLLEKADGWWYICSSTHEGWAPADYLQYSMESNSVQETSSKQNGRHTKQPVFRTCSDFTAENEGEISVPLGEKVTVIEREQGGWWLVEYNGEEGWLPEAFLEQI